MNNVTKEDDSEELNSITLFVITFLSRTATPIFLRVRSRVALLGGAFYVGATS